MSQQEHWIAIRGRGHEYFKDLCAQGHTVIIVTHDPEIAQQAERIIEIKDGEILNDSGSKATKRTNSLPKAPHENSL